MDLPDLDVECPECSGAGAVQSEEWRAWWGRYHAAYNEPTAGPARDEIERANEAAGPEPEGPEEVTCGVCEGRQRVPTEDGDRLLTFLDRRFGPRLAAIESTLDRAEAAAVRTALRQEAI